MRALEMVNLLFEAQISPKVRRGGLTIGQSHRISGSLLRQAVVRKAD